MKSETWFRNFPAAITVTDADGIIIDLNNEAAEMFKKNGGYALIGKNAIDCHPEPSLMKVKQMYENGTLNVYTITKNGQKKLIYQAPYFINGDFSGFVEMCLDLPEEIPHFNRD